MKTKFAILLFGLLGALPLHAGPRLSLEALVKRATAIAEVSVQWKNQEGKSTVTINQWIKKPDAEVLQTLEKSPHRPQEWVGVCLPDGNLLKVWLKNYPHFEKDNIQVWKDTLAKGSYTSIVFFRPSPVGGQFKPTCETETLLAKGWQNHPGHETYLQELQALIKKQAPPPKPKPAPAPVEKKPPPPPSKKTGCGCSSL